MRDWLRVNPMLMLLIPLVIGIVAIEHSSSFRTARLHHSGIILDSLQTYTAVLADYPKARRKTWLCECLVQNSDMPSPARVYVYLYKDSMHTYLPPASLGDTLVLRAAFTGGEMLGTFDYGLYLQRKGISAVAYVPEGSWYLAAHAPASGPLYWRRSVVDYYQRLGITGRQLAVLSALTLGTKEYLDKEIQTSFQRAGAAHILAVSGLHTAVIAAVLIWILSMLGIWTNVYDKRSRRWIAALCLILALGAYAVLTGMSPSVLRSVLMLSLMTVAWAAFRQPVTLNIWAASAFLILCFRPMDIFSVSFQLSYMAVLALILYATPLTRLCPVQSIKQPLLRKAAAYIWGLIAVSVAAQIGVLPLTMYYFSQMNNCFILTNMVVIPLTGLIVVGALAVLLLGTVPYIGACVVGLEKTMLTALDKYVCFMERLPWAVTDIEADISMVILLYMAVAFATVALKKENNRWLAATAVCLLIVVFEYVCL